MERAVRAWALVHGRSFVLPEDVEALFAPVLADRVLLNPYRLNGDGDGDAADLMRRCLELAPRPGTLTLE